MVCNKHLRGFHSFIFRGWSLLQSLNGLFVLDDVDGVGLCGAAGHELELCVLAEALEGLAGRPADVDVLDAGGVEVLGLLLAFGGEFDVEAAEFSERHLVAGEHHLAEAIDGLGDDGGDVGAVVGAAVAGDVFSELAEVEFLVDLRSAVGLGFGDVLLLRSGRGGHDANAVGNHGFSFFRELKWELKWEINGELTRLRSWPIVLAPCGIVQRVALYFHFYFLLFTSIFTPVNNRLFSRVKFPKFSREIAHFHV